MGQSPPSDDYLDLGEALPFLQGNAEFGRRHPSAKQACATAAKRALPGDLLLSVRAPVGALNVADQQYGIGRGLCAVQPRPGVLSPSFAWHALHVTREQLHSVATGSTYVAVSAWDVGNIVMPAPALEVQHRIADFLDRKTAAIDELIAKKERLTELLQEQRQALISQAVTKGLDPDVPMKDSGVGWIGDIPAHWEAKKFKYVCRLETGHTPRRSVDEWWMPDECTIPWVSLNDTKTLEAADYISKTRYQISPTGMANSSAHLIPAGAVVFNRDGARVGLAAITTKPMAVSQHIIAWLCGTHMLNTYLLYVLYAMKPELYRITAGSTIPTIGMPEVLATSTPVPPLGEQGRIVAHVRSSLEQLDVVVERVQEQKRLLREYRQALITEAVTGKLEIPKAREVAA